jgi:hypothetical protein
VFFKIVERSFNLELLYLSNPKRPGPDPYQKFTGPDPMEQKPYGTGSGTQRLITSPVANIKQCLLGSGLNPGSRG